MLIFREGKQGGHGDKSADGSGDAVDFDSGWNK